MRDEGVRGENRIKRKVVVGGGKNKMRCKTGGLRSRWQQRRRHMHIQVAHVSREHADSRGCLDEGGSS